MASTPPALLAPGASAEQANAELKAITTAFTREGLYPEAMRFEAIAVSFVDEILAPIKPALWLVSAATLFLLLIACANVANLLLARAESRRKELALRTALGAGRLRLLRPLLAETLILATAGGGLGLLLAFAGMRLLASANLAAIPRASDARVDVAVLGFAVLVTLVDGAGVQRGARAARLARRSHRFAERRRAERDRRQRPSAHAQRAGRRRDGAGGRPARLGRPGAAKPVGAATGAPRLRPRQRAHAAPLACRRRRTRRRRRSKASTSVSSSRCAICPASPPRAPCARCRWPRRSATGASTSRATSRRRATAPRAIGRSPPTVRSRRWASGSSPDDSSRRRSRGHAAGGGRQRDDGEEVLEGRQPNRPADPDGQPHAALDHRRRDRRRPAAQRRRHGGEGEVLPPARAVLAGHAVCAAGDDAGREDRRRPVAGAAGDPP